MISFFTGVPGSGKTYYAVDKIFNNFSNDKEALRDKKATFEICYTNINEFQFSNVEHVFFLDFDDLKIKLTSLHKMYKDKCTDDELIEKCKEYNIYNALFVIDEAHNYFDVKDVVLIWWLSYHRHLFHEIILITQNLSLIESKYKSFSEFFYKAFAQSLTLFKTHFKYNVYCTSRMAQNSKSGTVKIKRNKKVFELYKSGDSINSQNVVFRILGLGLFFLLLLVVVVYFYSESLKAPADEETNISQSSAISQNQPAQNQTYILTPQAVTTYNNQSFISAPKNNYKSKKYISLTCNSSNCYNELISLPIPLITYFVKNNDLTLLYTNEINKNYLKMYFSADEDLYNFLVVQNQNQGVGNVQKNNNSFLPAFSSPAATQSR